MNASPALQAATFHSGGQLLHNVIIIKFVITVIILIGAVTTSTLYNKTRANDTVSKNKLKFASDVWFGEQSGLVGTMMILWLPTLLFFTLVRLVPTKYIELLVNPR